MFDDLYYHTALGPYPMEGGVVDRPRCNEPIVAGQQVSNVEAAQAWARSLEAKEAIRTAHEAVSEMMRHLQAERRIDPDDLRVPMMVAAPVTISEFERRSKAPRKRIDDYATSLGVDMAKLNPLIEAVLRAADAIGEHMHGKTRDRFQRAQLAVRIGEACRQLSEGE
jgi:predicted TIM-barrel fold metal-dependent hydrolase